MIGHDIRDALARHSCVNDRTERDMAFKLLRNFTSIIETEILETVLSFTRARLPMLKTTLTTRPTVH